MVINNRVKKNPEKIKKEIIRELNKGPKGTSEISENINSNWLTTEKFLIELIESKDIIEIISASKSKVYASRNDLSFFYLPLSEDIREKTFSLLDTFSKRWQEKTGKIPSKTVLQKLAVEFVEDDDKLYKEIPVLRFHYGQTLALRYEEGIDVSKFKLNETQNKKLNNLIQIYKNYSSKEAKDRQYEKSSMKFYKEKEQMSRSLVKDSKIAENKIFNLMVYYYPDLSESFALFDRMAYCAINILNLKKHKEEWLSDFKEVYSLIWDCLTTEAYFNDIERFIAPDKIDLFFQIKSNYLTSKITNVRDVLDELESGVNSLDSGEINSPDSVSEFVHGMFVD